MIHPETHPVTATHGPRPAGNPGECFYCHNEVGTEHKPDCVMRERTIVIRYSIDVCIAVPEDWTPEQIEAHRNNGRWCFDNIYSELERGDEGCLCDVATAKYVKEADEDDELRWNMNRSLVE